MALAPAVYLIPLLIAVFLMMAAKSWDTSFGPLLQYLADRLDNLRIPLPRAPDISLPNIGGIFRAADKYVRAGLTRAIAFTVQPFIVFMRYVADLIEAPALEVAEFAADTLHALNRFQRYVVPRLIAVSGAGLLVEAVRRLTAAVLPRLGRIERDMSGAWARIQSISRAIAPAAILATVAVAISKLGFGWARCTRVKKLGRRACSLDSGYLDALLAGTLLLVSAYSLREFAEEMQEITPDIAEGVRDFLRMT